MTQKLKIACGLISLGLAVFNFASGNIKVGIYWVVVVAYWIANYMGGRK